jgi:hypothetical protein
MLRYRKKVGSDFRDWHFVDLCASWPRSAYVEREDYPPLGDLCDLCLSVYGEKIFENYRKRASMTQTNPLDAKLVEIAVGRDKSS